MLLFCSGYPILASEMPKERKSRRSDDAAKLNKQPKMFRLMPDDIRKLKEAALQTGVTETAYVQVALRAQFKKDGIK
jgi:hypothetical protein